MGVGGGGERNREWTSATGGPQHHGIMTTQHFPPESGPAIRPHPSMTPSRPLGSLITYNAAKHCSTADWHASTASPCSSRSHASPAACSAILACPSCVRFTCRCPLQTHLPCRVVLQCRQQPACRQQPGRRLTGVGGVAAALEDGLKAQEVLLAHGAGLAVVLQTPQLSELQAEQPQRGSVSAPVHDG